MFFNPSHQPKSAHEVVVKAIEAAKKMGQMPQRGAIGGWTHLSQIAGRKHLFFSGENWGGSGMRGDENNSIEYYQSGEWQSFAGPFEPYEIHKCEELDMKVDDDPNKKVTNIYKKVGNFGISHLDPRNAKQAMTFASQVCSSRIQAHHHEGLYSQNAGIRQVKWGFFEKIFQPKSPRWLLGWFTQMESFVQTDHVGKFLESGIGPSFDRNMFQPTSLFFASFFSGEGREPIVPINTLQKLLGWQIRGAPITSENHDHLSPLRFVFQVSRWDLVCQTSNKRRGWDPGIDPGKKRFTP